MAKLKIDWTEFRMAAIEQLKKQYPMINENKMPYFMITDDRGAEMPIYQPPEIVEIELI